MQSTEEKPLSYKQVAMMIADQLGEKKHIIRNIIVNIVYTLGIHQSYELAKKSLSTYKNGGMLTKPVHIHKTNGIIHTTPRKDKVRKKTAGGIFLSYACDSTLDGGKKLCKGCMSYPHAEYLKNPNHPHKRTASTPPQKKTVLSLHQQPGADGQRRKGK